MAKILAVSKRSKSWKFGHAVVAFVILSISGMAFLAMLRNDSQSYDMRLNELQNELVAMEKENRTLEREVASYMSPRDVRMQVANLGMSEVHIAGTIRINGVVNSDGTATARVRFSEKGL